MAYQIGSSRDTLLVLEQIATADAAFEETQRRNLATLFAECFAPWFTDFPLHPSERWAIVERLLTASPRSQTFTLGCQALFAITTPPHTLSGYSSERQRHDDQPLSILWRDLYDHRAKALNRHIKLATRIGPAREIAARKLHYALFEAADHIPPDQSMPFVEQTCEEFFRGRLKSSVSNVRFALDHLHRRFSELLEKNRETEWANLLPTYLVKLEGLIARVESGPLHLRFEMWINRSHHNGWKQDPATGKRRYQIALEAIASEFVAEPRAFTPKLVNILFLPEAVHAMEFCGFVGRADRSRKLWSRFARLEERPSGDRFFAAYCRGVDTHDHKAVERYLDRAMSAPEHASVTLVQLSILGPTSENRLRLGKLLRSGHVTPRQVAMHIGGFWLSNLPVSEVLRVFKFIAADTAAENTRPLLDVICHYIHGKEHLSPSLLPVTQRALSRKGTGDADMNYNCDQIALTIAKTDLKRGQQVLKSAVTSLLKRGLGSWRDVWNPLDTAVSSGDFIKHLTGQSPKETYLQMLRYLCSKARFSRIERDNPLFDLGRDSDAILQLATGNEEYGLAIAGEMRPAQPGYWSFAARLLQLHPESARLRASLAGTLHLSWGWGRYSDRLIESIKLIDEQLKVSNLSVEFRSWLEATRSEMSRRQTEQRQTESD